MLTQEESDEVINQIKSYLGERSINFAFAILDEDGDLRYDYSNWRVGKMLFSDSLIDMAEEMVMDNVIWSEAEDDDDE